MQSLFLENLLYEWNLSESIEISGVLRLDVHRVHIRRFISAQLIKHALHTFQSWNGKTVRRKSDDRWRVRTREHHSILNAAITDDKKQNDWKTTVIRVWKWKLRKKRAGVSIIIVRGASLERARARVSATHSARCISHVTINVTSASKEDY